LDRLFKDYFDGILLLSLAVLVWLVLYFDWYFWWLLYL